jgi:hypothetical protein
VTRKESRLIGATSSFLKIVSRFLVSDFWIFPLSLSILVTCHGSLSRRA